MKNQEIIPHHNLPSVAVSVITPCYNSADYVIETLESLSTQTFPNFEIIAIDDGSTDNTLQILQEYAKKEPRLHVISQENTYVIQARMNAVQQATGKYLIFLDSDDKLAPTYIEKCVTAAENGADIVYSNLQCFEASNEIADLTFNLLRLLTINTIYIGALIRKEKFDAVGGFDTSMRDFEDWELWIRLIKNGATVHHIPEPLFFYRKRHAQTSITDTADKQKINAAVLQIYTKHQDFYLQNDVCIRNMFMNHFLNVQQKQKDCQRKQQHYRQPLRKWFYQTFKPKKWAQLCEEWHIQD